MTRLLKWYEEERDNVAGCNGGDKNEWELLGEDLSTWTTEESDKNKRMKRELTKKKERKWKKTKTKVAFHILRLKLLRGYQLFSELQFLKVLKEGEFQKQKSALLFNWFIYNCTFPGKRIVTIVALAIGCQWTSNHIVHCAIGAGKTVTFTLTSTTFVIRNGLQGNILESYVLLFQFISVLLQFLDRLIWDL